MCDKKMNSRIKEYFDEVKSPTENWVRKLEVNSSNSKV
jgi:hypothetical protein